MNEQLISQVPLFASLPYAEIQHLADMLRPNEVPPDAILFREGEYGDQFYLVREGQVEIIKALGTPDERLVGVRGPGEFLGEMSLLSREGLRTASARARTSTLLLELTRADFETLLARQPALAYQMLEVLSARLNNAHNIAIRDLREKNRRLMEAYQALQAAQAQIIEKEKLEHELHVARGVQASLLPRATPQLPGWDFAACWRPAREVSGDFYDFIPLSPPSAPDPARHWGLVIADVSDKGMPAALFMALSRSIVRATVTTAPAPVYGIAQANRLIHADSVDSMFVTLCYTLLDAMTYTLTVVNAGHSPPLTYRTETDELDRLTRTGPALGVDPEAVFEQRTLRLAPGDFVVLYTDGVTDAVNANAEEFGMRRLQQVVFDHRRDSAEAIVAAVNQALAGFIGPAAPFDDVTLVVAKRLSA